MSIAQIHHQWLQIVPFFPFKAFEDFVAVDNLNFFDDVASVGGDSTQGSLG